MYKKLSLLVLIFLNITSGFSACDIVGSDEKLVDNRLYLRENLDSKDINTTNIFGIDSGKYTGLYDTFSIDSSVNIDSNTGVISSTDELNSDIDTTFHATGPQITNNYDFDINYKVQSFNQNVTFDYTKYAKTNYPITLVYKDENLTHVTDQALTLNYKKHNNDITIEYERVDSAQKTVAVPSEKFIFDVDSIYTDINKTVDITYPQQSKFKTIAFTYKNKSTTLAQNKFNLTYKTHNKSNLLINLNYSDSNSSVIDNIDIKTLSGFTSDDFNFLNATGLPTGLNMNTSGIISGTDATNSSSATISFTYQNNTIDDIDIKTSNFLNNTQAHDINITNLQSGLNCDSNGVISGATTGQSIANAITNDTLVEYKDDEIVDIDLKGSDGVDDDNAREFSISSLPANLNLDTNTGVLSGSYANHPNNLSKTINYKNNEINNINLKDELLNTDAREFNISSDLNGLSYDTNIGVISGTLSTNNPIATDMNITLSYKSNKINDIDLMTIIDATHTDAREFTKVTLPAGLNVNSSGIVSGTVDIRSDIYNDSNITYFRNTIKDVNLSSQLEEQYSTILNSRIFSEYTSLPSGLSIDSDNRTIKGVMTTFDAIEQDRFYYYTNEVDNSTNLYSIINEMDSKARAAQNTVFPDGINFVGWPYTSTEENKSLYAWYLKIGGSIAPDNESDLSNDITFSLDYYASNEINDILLPSSTYLDDNKFRNFINYLNIPNGLLKNKDGKIYGTVNLRPSNSTVNIDFDYYTSTINPIDIHDSSYTDDSIARFFTKQFLVSGLDIDYTTGIISGDVTNPNSYDITLASNISIDYYNNEIMPVNLGSENIIKSGVTDYNSTLFESYLATNLNGLNISSSVGVVSGTTSSQLGDGKTATINTDLSYTPKELTFAVVVKDHPKINLTNLQADKSYFDLTKSSFDLNRYFIDDSDDNISYSMEKSSKYFGLPKGFSQDEQCHGDITGSLNDNIDNNAMRVKAQDILGQEIEHTFILRYVLD